jgi:hypothetical protein
MIRNLFASLLLLVALPALAQTNVVTSATHVAGCTPATVGWVWSSTQWEPCSQPVNKVSQPLPMDEQSTSIIAVQRCYSSTSTTAAHCDNQWMFPHNVARTATAAYFDKIAVYPGETTSTWHAPSEFIFASTTPPPPAINDTVSWVNPTTRVDGTPLTNLAKVRIEWGTAQGGPYTGQTEVTAPGTSIVIPRSGTGVGTFCYVGFAFDATGLQSPQSNETCKTVSAPAPASPPSAPVITVK